MRSLPFVLLLLCAACAEAPLHRRLDSSSHVERVLEDVTAMLEGMAAAHTEQRAVWRDPGFRSSGPRGPR